MAVLGDARHERVAQLLAAGCSAEDASAQAGYDTTKSSWRSNARKRAQREDIQGRVRELQGQVADKLVDVTVEFIQQRAARIAAADVPLEDIKASDVIAACRLLAQMIPGALAVQKVTPTDIEGNGPPVIEITWKDPIASTDRS